MNENGFPTQYDGHRVCVQCEMLERGTWAHPWMPDPWLCAWCFGRASVDPHFAEEAAGNLRFLVSELVLTWGSATLGASLDYLIAIWRETEAGRLQATERQDDDIPF